MNFELEKGRLGYLLVEQGLCTREAVISALRSQLNGDARRLGEILIERGVLSPNQVLEVLGEISTKAKATHPALLAAAAPTAAPAAEPVADATEHAETGGVRTEGGRSIAESSVRVDVSLLDGLIDLVGELVLARNQLVQLTGSRASKGNPTAAASQRVSLITSELQERVMKTRMQAINVVWGKLPRVVRDLSIQCGKQVRVEMEGQDTELDKTIIEAIKDPLTHIVRNSVDHGIENPIVRENAGKNATGVLKLRAFHEGGKVVIEIIDDGGGINPTKVKAKAVEKGVITAEQAESMSDTEAVHLIYAPGFSTAEAVTNVSGRGVGMDVVKTNIEKIGGTLDVQSTVGVGTTLIIRIPLTLAIVPALIVQAGGSRFAVPQPNLLELVRLKDEATALEWIDGASFYRLRGQLLPVLDLCTLLSVERQVAEGRSAKARSLAVLQVDGIQFGIMVDRVNDAEEIVVKPLGPHLKGVDFFAGCTVMGDGSVALILDIMSIARWAKLTAANRTIEVQNDKVTVEFESLLLCMVGETKVAVPMASVARLEHVKPESLELAGQQEVVKYGKHLLPVVRLHQFLGAYAELDSVRRIKMVVTGEENGHSIGIVVDQILDSVRVPAGSVSVQGGGGRYGMLGTTVINDEVTEVVDIAAITSAVDESYFRAETLAMA
ncbi:MAG: chemotaxis protein CheA [Acidimicrobiia bacterium]